MLFKFIWQSNVPLKSQTFSLPSKEVVSNFLEWVEGNLVIYNKLIVSLWACHILVKVNKWLESIATHYLSNSVLKFFLLCEEPISYAGLYGW